MPPEWSEGFGPIDDWQEPDPELDEERPVTLMGVFQRQTLLEDVEVAHFVILEDEDHRSIDIFIGRTEALAIHFGLEGELPDRPSTHDLIRNLIERTGHSVDRVIIDDLWGRIYYARLVLLAPDGSELVVDARPSDAIAVAVRVKCPITATERVLRKASTDS